MLTIVDKTIELFEEARRECGNHYLYLELAWTKHTGWMCWLQNREGGEEHKYNFVPPGQGADPSEACAPVLRFLQTWKDCGWEPYNPPPLLPNTPHPFDGRWALLTKPQAPGLQGKPEIITGIVGDLEKTNGHRPECVCPNCTGSKTEKDSCNEK